jgi:hypothetical protein
MAKTSDQSFAVVTPTYLPDLARCELLAESLDRVAPEIPHYLIVSRHERAAFGHLEGGSRRIIEAEEILGNWIVRMPGRQGGIWLSLKAMPVRGWIIQQIVKIGAIELIPAHTLVFCDSDVVFFRHFRYDDLLVEGKVGLLDVDSNANSFRWTVTGRRLLGVPPSKGGDRNHVGYVVSWNREIIRAMQQRIELSTNLNWQIALARTPSFSEYTIYGVFVREILGYETVDHAPSTVPLVKASWGEKFKSEKTMENFFSDFDPRTIAVMIHSKDGIDPARYRPYLEHLWKLQ